MPSFKKIVKKVYKAASKSVDFQNEVSPTAYLDSCYPPFHDILFHPVLYCTVDTMFG